MPLNETQQRELNRMIEEKTKETLNDFQEAYKVYITNAGLRTRAGELPAPAGLDESKYNHLYSVEAAAELGRLRGANPYLPAEIREKMEFIYHRSLSLLERVADDRAASAAMESVIKEADSSNRPEISNEAAAIKRMSDERLRDATAHIGMSGMILRYLNGELGYGAAITPEAKEYAKSAFGLELGRDEVDEARKEIVQPEKLTFTCEMTENVDRDRFLMRFRETDRQGEEPYQMELYYAHATFGRAFNGIFGVDGRPVAEGHPMYLGKFDNIFIDGKSVAEICRDATDGMSAKEANDYMIVHATAAAMDRKSHIDCVMPKTKLTTGPDGTVKKDILPGRQPGSKIMSVVSDVKEITPKPNWIKRVLSKIGLYRITTAQSEYEKMLANDKDGDIRKADIEGHVLRGEIQRLMFGQMQELQEPHNSSDAFFELNDLAEINGEAAETISHREVETYEKNRHLMTYHEKCEIYFNDSEVGGISTLGRGPSRTSMVRLYMLSKGYDLDQVVSSDDSNIETKRQIGKEFYEILHSKNPEAIGRMYAQMAETLGNMKLPDIDYTNSAQMAAGYKELHLIHNFSIDLSQSLRLRNEEAAVPRERRPYEHEFVKAIGEENLSVLDNVLQTSQLTSMFTTQFQSIGSDYYSEINRDMPIKNQVAMAGVLKTSDKNLSAANAVASKCIMKVFNEMYADAKGKPLRQINSSEPFVGLPMLQTYLSSEINHELGNDPDALKQKLDYFNGKSSDTVKRQMEQTVEAVKNEYDVKLGSVKIVPENMARFREIPVQPVAKAQIEKIDVGDLIVGSGLKQANIAKKNPQQREIKPDPQNGMQRG